MRADGPRRFFPGRHLAQVARLAAILGVLAAVVVGQDLNSSSTIRIGVQQSGAYEIVTLPLETYVARVLTGEALPGSEPAALEALAVAIRTYAVGNRGKHRADGFDLCDQTHCQVMRTASAVTERAALATAGRVLLYGGEPASVFYHASCGGRTEKPSNVWPGADDPPYLPSRDDDGCGGFPAWRTELSLGDLQRALRAAGFTGTLRNVRVADRNESSRASRLALEGLTPGFISGQDLRAAIGRAIGWQYLQSAAFELTRTGDRFRFAGRGAGHGVGMCVIGSTKLAIRGQTATQILARYYPGTELGGFGPRLTAAPPERPSVGPPPRAARTPPPVDTPPPTDIVVSLSEGDDGERAIITTLVRRERDDLARALGMPAPQRLIVRFHPTTDTFEQATGRPWYTLGTATPSEIDFIPLVVLRDRGILERTVRHQLVHVLADPVLGDRPVWAREGAAAYFSEPRSDARSTQRPACPGDVEILRPLSAGAFSDAVARARTCFERQVAAKESWRDVR